MSAHFITGLFKRLTSLFKNSRPVAPTEHLEERQELILRSPGPVVYLYKSDAYYKLGRTRNVHKRDKQIKLQLPFRAIPVHVIYTDDEVWLERFWHKEFAAKRRNGEWFELDAKDVARFCSQDEMFNPSGTTQAQLEFHEPESQPAATRVRDKEAVASQSNHKAAIVGEVESHYNNLTALHPNHTRLLQKSRKRQIEKIDAEARRLKQERNYGELQAFQEWKRKAIMAADAIVR